jgi:hypothetical protein
LKEKGRKLWTGFNVTNKTSSCKEGEELLYYLSDYKLLKRGSSSSVQKSAAYSSIF